MIFGLVSWFLGAGLLQAEGLNEIQIRKKTYQKLVKDFLRSAAAIDDNIGKMLRYLDAEGLTDNTVIIYTSDQGYFLGEHGMFDKRMFLEESARMPFVIRYPQEIHAGKKNKDMILNIDFPALMLDYAGIPQHESFQGNSFRKNLYSETPTQWRDKMYYRYYAHALNRPAHFGIRSQRYKLIFYYGLSLGLKGTYTDKASKPAWEFYDLENDPNELKNEYKNPTYQSIIDTHPKVLLAYKRLASLYAGKKAYLSALDYLKRAAQLAPRDTMIFYNLAIAFMHCQDRDNAEKSINHALLVAKSDSERMLIHDLGEKLFL